LNRPGVRRKPALALLALVLGVQATAGAATAAGATLRQRLDRALTVQGVSRDATGALAINLRNGGTVYALHASRSLEPASNQKLTVALAALDRLGAAYRVPTDVFGVGSQNGAVWRGALVLKGHGDPSLVRADLRTLADRIHDLGIRRITGRIVGDESYYDLKRTCSGWKASWYKIESPPLSALVVSPRWTTRHSPRRSPSGRPSRPEAWTSYEGRGSAGSLPTRCA
jgi:D-alanyl-D-alanine carboxypeptidase/D-alanyl-D-alanine-endopeptidase (penicillin-binding protein 4)